MDAIKEIVSTFPEVRGDRGRIAWLAREFFPELIEQVNQEIQEAEELVSNLANLPARVNVWI